jgi:hypothetical protein
MFVMASGNLRALLALAVSELQTAHQPVAAYAAADE